MDKNQILDKLKKINYPGFNRDIVSFGMVKDVVIDNNTINELLILFKEFRTIIKITYNSILIKDTLTIHRQKGSRFIVKNIWEGSNKH